MENGRQELVNESETIEYKPSRREALKEYVLNIEFLDRGCVVKVGCKSIAFEDVERAMTALIEYTKNPWELQQEWRKVLD